MHRLAWTAPVPPDVAHPPHARLRSLREPSKHPSSAAIQLRRAATVLLYSDGMPRAASSARNACAWGNVALVGEHGGRLLRFFS